MRHSVDHHPEEVSQPFVWQRLVPNHEATRANHGLLDLGWNCRQFLPPIGIFWFSPHARRYVMKAHIGAAGAFHGGKGRAKSRSVLDQ